MSPLRSCTFVRRGDRCNRHRTGSASPTCPAAIRPNSNNAMATRTARAARIVLGRALPRFADAQSLAQGRRTRAPPASRAVD